MKIVIVGSGTSGLMCALTVKQLNPAYQVSIIAAESIPTIEVGESTTGFVTDFLFNTLAIDLKDFFRKVRPGFKVGLRLHWGKKDREYFDHAFDLMYQHNGMKYSWGDLYDAKEGSIGTVGSELMRRNISPFRADCTAGVPYAMHLENAVLIDYLTDLCLERGIEIVNDKISGLDGKGEIFTVAVGEKNKYEADFFINCGGFNSPLNSSDNEFKRYDNLMCDSAIVTNVKRKDEQIACYTGVHTMPNGWMWEIHHINSLGFGYVYSSKHVSDDQAKNEFSDFLGYTPEKTRVLKFKSGRREKVIVGNVAHIGNSYGFCEPLQAMSISLFCLASAEVALYLRTAGKEPSSSLIYSVNKYVGHKYDSYAEFIQLHYKFNEKLDTGFWKDIRKLDLPERYVHGVDLYNRFGQSNLLATLGYGTSEIEEFGNIYKGCSNVSHDRFLSPEDIDIATKHLDMVLGELKTYLPVGEAYQALGVHS